MIIRKIAVYLVLIALIYPGAILASDDLMNAIQVQNQVYMLICGTQTIPAIDT
jgi:hypothetical protein